MDRRLGHSKSIFYFDVCGQVNTEKTLELAVQRAQQLGIKKVIVASETGLSALRAVEALRHSGIGLVVVTSAAGTKVEKTGIGDLKIGIPDKTIRDKLKKAGAQIVRGTDPLYNIGAALENHETPTLATFVRFILKIISSGTAVCVGVTMMATDNGIVKEGEEVVAIAGSWVGLDTALVLQAANSVNFFKRGVVQIREIICKPRNPVHSWPINQTDWVGDLESYKKFVE